VLGPVVLDHAVGVQDIGTDLASQAMSSFESSTAWSSLRFFSSSSSYRRARRIFRAMSGFSAATLILTRHDDPGGEVRDAYGRIGRIDRLAAGSEEQKVSMRRSFSSIWTSILSSISDRRRPRRSSCGACGGIEGRDPHQAMHAALACQITVGEVSFHHEGGRFDSSLLPVLVIQHFGCVCRRSHHRSTFGPAFLPSPGFRPPAPGWMSRSRWSGRDLLREACGFRCGGTPDRGGRPPFRARRAHPRPRLQAPAGLGDRPLHATACCPARCPARGGALLERRLRLLHAVPKTWCRDPAFDFRQLGALVGSIKDNLGPVPPSVSLQQPFHAVRPTCSSPPS